MEEKTVKKTLFAIILTICIFTGILYNDYVRQEGIGTATIEQIYVIPDMIVNFVPDPILF